MQHFLVYFGSFATTFRCGAATTASYARGQAVVCRTPRGVELGTVRCEMESAGAPEGTILRCTTVEDELLRDRLDRYRHRAVQRCQQRLQEMNSAATLIDVDPLFDGRTLLFYFLGPIDDQVQRLTDTLAKEYERQVGAKHFAKLLAEGCGPGCGTDEKAGGGCSGGCSVCIAAAICKTKQTSQP